MAVLVQARPADPHRLRDEVCRNGTLAEHHRLNIPRSTAATWRSRGPRPGVTLEEFDQDRQQLPDRIENLRRRARVLAAVVRLLFTLLRISGFRLSGERLPAGEDKARLLRAIAGAEPVVLARKTSKLRRACRSRRPSNIPMVQAADPQQRDHLPELPRLDRASDRRVAVEPHVRAVIVVVGGVLAD